MCFKGVIFMKKNVLLISIFVIILICMFFFLKKNDDVKFSFEDNFIHLKIDEKVEIPLLLSSNKLYKEIVYSNYDNEIIDVIDNKYIKGKKVGSTVLFATLNNNTINLYINVIGNDELDKDDDYELNNSDNNVENNNISGIPMNDYKFPKVTPITKKNVLKVLIVDIDPVLTKGNIEGRSCSGKEASKCLNQNKQQVINELINDIEDSSHGIIDVQIVKTDKINEFATHKNTITLLNGKKANRLDENTWLDIMKNGWYDSLEDKRIKELGSYSFDYEYILNKLDIINRRNNNEFDEVWLVNVDPTKTFESIMVGKSAYWINGKAINKNCDNFRIMNVSISRPDVNFECNGHAAEDILNKVFNTNISYKANVLSIDKSNYNSLNLWEKFTLVEHHNSIKNTGLSGVGDIHFSPNSTKDYDWKNYNNKVNSKWREWLNYPYLTTDSSTEVFTPNIYMNKSLSGTKSAARLHHRWWFSLMPHVSGYTIDGYSNNWWDYLYLSDYITEIQSINEEYVYKVGDYIDNIKFKLRFNSLKDEIYTIDRYEQNMNFLNKNIFNIYENGKIVAAKEGNSILKYYRDGKEASINIIIN